MVTKKLFLISIASAIAFWSNGQGLFSNYSFELNLGAEIPAIKSYKHAYLGVGGSLSWIGESFMLSADYLYLEEGEVGIAANSHPETFQQVGLLAGKQLVRGQLVFEGQVGIGGVFGKNIEEGSANGYKTNSYFTVGIPLKVKCKWQPLPFMAVGASLQTNLNSEKILFTPMLCLEFGRLKTSSQ